MVRHPGHLLAFACALSLTPKGSAADGVASAAAERALEIARACAADPAAAAASATATTPLGAGERALLARAREVLFSTDGFYAGAAQSRLDALEPALVRLATGAGRADAQVQHLMAMVLYRRGRKEAAAARAATALLLCRRSSRFYSNFAFLLAATGRRGEARVAFDAARAIDPDNTAVHIGLLWLASADADSSLDEVRTLANDWCWREPDPSLRVAALALRDGLTALTSVETDGRQGDGVAELAAVRTLVRELFGAQGDAP
jgi:tetratricopeptide (TPR) repeat protein